MLNAKTFAIFPVKKVLPQNYSKETHIHDALEGPQDSSNGSREAKLSEDSVLSDDRGQKRLVNLDKL